MAHGTLGSLYTWASVKERRRWSGAHDALDLVNMDEVRQPEGEEQGVTGLEFGMTLPFTGISEFARQAEDLGYDYLASGEHVTFYGPQANAFIALSVAAGATQRVKLVSSASLLALYPAALAAKMIAMLDAASGGRFNLGVGVGGEFPVEYEACGVPVQQRGARTNEALEVIDKLLTSGDISFQGRFSRFEHVTIEPRPVQQPRPPFWIAGRKEPAMRRAARFGDAWMPYMYTPQQLRNSIDTINGLLPNFGRVPGAVRPALFSWFAVGPDDGDAKRMAAEVVSRFYQQDFSRLVDRYILAGSPASCVRRLGEYVDAGLAAVILNPACPAEQAAGMMQLFAEEVIPAFSAQPTVASV